MGLIMKKFTLLLLIACLIAGAQARAQTITYQKKNASLKNLINTIVRQTGYDIIFKGEPLEKIKRVDITVTNASIKDVLDIFMKDQQLVYTISGNLITISPKTPSPSEVMTLTGRVTNETGEPVPGATISIVGSSRSIAGNDEGEFLFPEVPKLASLIITSVNHDSAILKLEGKSVIHVRLKPNAKELSEVSVIVSTGYQNVVQERSVGSYSKVNNELLNRRVSANVLERLDGVTPGMIFNKNIVPGTFQSTMTIRGRSTIFSNAEPLIVIDNFPYYGNPDNINPNDIESITILKDANAAAIWGAFAGNGVIVMTSKKGRYRQEPRLTLNNYVTIGAKPDAYYLPSLETDKYIDLELELFEDGFYTDILNSPVPTVISPVVELLNAEKNGLISTIEMESQLNGLRKQDTRREKKKYLYRNSVSQQHALSTSGGGANNHYYLSAGFDRSLYGEIGDKSHRITLNANNTYSWFKDRLELSTGIYYSESKITANFEDAESDYPYLKYLNADGQAIPIPRDIRQSTKRMLMDQYPLRDWNYNPVQEINTADNTAKIVDYRITAALKYKVAKGITANLIYQFNKGQTDEELYRSPDTYFTRNMFNRFSQFTGGEIVSRVPDGGITDRINNEYKAHNMRMQLNYLNSWEDRNGRNHSISALAGAEVRVIDREYQSNRLFGYSKGSSTNEKVDDSTEFPLFYAPFLTEKIQNPHGNRKFADNYISYFMTANYTFKRKYTLSVSARKDESNLFGVETNQKGVPLYSVGGGWNISHEAFYHINWLPVLKLRITHGTYGNVDKSVSANTTTIVGASNFYRAETQTILHPPNPNLRWEKMQMTNFGIDFTIAKDIVSGNIDYFIKNGTDLIGMGPIDPTTGISQIRANVAAMKGSGIDISLKTTIINQKVLWTSTILFNRSVDKVTNYKVKQNSIGSYSNDEFLYPLEDRPVYSIFSLKWAGLDPQTGDPRGYFNNSVTNDYLAINTSTSFSDLIFNGPATPTYFGSLRNNISWNQFSLSLNIVWKAGYYFRRSSIDYSKMLMGVDKGHPDYNLRWKKPGDEKVTNIPSLSVLLDPQRDIFFGASEVLIERGDHLRLQDIQLTYTLDRQQYRKLPLRTLHFYLYANNIGIIWKATDANVDPDYLRSIPNQRTFSAGIKLDF
jgi:TonB-linked SusC/RagA family outer membrane protein